MKHYCIIGFPVAHALSPQMHNAAFQALGLDADFEKREVRPEDLANFMADFRDKYSGMSVTIPHKESVMKFLDEIDNEAKAVGAVNTVVNKNGKLVGYNTDVYGAMRALQEGMGLKNEEGQWLAGGHAAVLGAGGAARAILYGLLQAGAEVTIFNRTIEKAKKLAQEFKAKFADLSNFRPEDFEILINATSVGMHPYHQESPLPLHSSGFFGKFIAQMTGKFVPIVMDIIYSPKETRLIREAKQLGATVITGDRMLLYQGAKAFELWTGQNASLKIMEQTLLRHLG